MVKTLYITGSMPPLRCGIGFYTDTLLDHTGIDFDLLSTEGLVGHKKAGKTFYTPDWKLRRLPRLLKMCRSGRYDIIHIQYPAKGYKRQLGINKLPYLLRLFASSKIIVTLHEYHGSGILGKSRDFITALPAHRLIVSNNMDYDAVPWILRRKAVINPIGSNVPVAKPNKKTFDNIIAKAKFNPKEKVIVYFGFPYPNKGLETVIDATRISDFQLLLLTELDGKDPYQKTLLDKVKKANKEGAKIYVAGFLDNKPFSEVIQECDYFLLPQPLPITGKSGTTITAAIHKLPIISTAAGNPKYNLPYINNKNAVLIRDMTPENLANAVAKLPKHSPMQKEVGELARYFDWNKITKSHQQIYEELTK